MSRRPDGQGELVVEKAGDVWVLILRGEHDLATAGTLNDELDAIYAHGSKVLLDLSQLEFLDSTILGKLVRGATRATEAAEHGFAIAAPPESQARRILRLVALDRQLPVYDSTSEALAALTQSDDA
jgi:anti-anti-sigma factor